MKKSEQPIGVLDSGVGGLTVVRKLQELLPREDIIYLGDSANVPYGNRSEDEIFSLTTKMLHFLEKRQVKCIAVACNTISALIQRLRAPFPLISIVEAGVDFVLCEKLSRIGLIATEFTVKKGAYDTLIHSRAPHCEVISEASPCLAALIDKGDFDDSAIDTEIRQRVGCILSRAPVEHLMLACTHFPIVADRFHTCYPQLRLIDPAEQQAKFVDRVLTAHSWHSGKKSGAFSVYTTGDPSIYATVARRLALQKLEVCEQITLARPSC